MADEAHLKHPLPPPPNEKQSVSNHEDHRLWIGNIDTRVTEFSLLKILQKFGTLNKFDFLYHKGGPDQGKSRGYCFVTYSTKQESEKAMKALNGKQALSKRIIVKPALTERDEYGVERQASATNNRGLPGTSRPLSNETQIRAIEAKLKAMEHSTDLSCYRPEGNRSESKISHHTTNQNNYRKPYHRPQNTRRR